MNAQLHAVQLSIQAEPFAAVFAEAEALMSLHWEEIAKNKYLLRINPDLDMYHTADSLGRLVTVSARDDRRLVGYILWLLTPHPHYKHVLVAEDDLHFLLPEYRRGIAGYRFLKSAISLARSAGARMIVMREKIGHLHPALMTRLGFTATDVVYTQVTE